MRENARGWGDSRLSVENMALGTPFKKPISIEDRKVMEMHSMMSVAQLRGTKVDEPFSEHRIEWLSAISRKKCRVLMHNVYEILRIIPKETPRISQPDYNPGSYADKSVPANGHSLPIDTNATG